MNALQYAQPREDKGMNEPVYTEEERMNRKPIRSPLKAIRAHCLECVCGVRKEVELCTAPQCWLYPFRFGSNPYRKPASKKQREAARRMAKNRRAAMNSTRKIAQEGPPDDPDGVSGPTAPRNRVPAQKTTQKLKAGSDEQPALFSN